MKKKSRNIDIHQKTTFRGSHELYKEDRLPEDSEKRSLEILKAHLYHTVERANKTWEEIAEMLGLSENSYTYLMYSKKFGSNPNNWKLSIPVLVKFYKERFLSLDQLLEVLLGERSMELLNLKNENVTLSKKVMELEMKLKELKSEESRTDTEQ